MWIGNFRLIRGLKILNEPPGTKQGHKEAQLNNFRLNDHTLAFHPKTQSYSEQKHKQ